MRRRFRGTDVPVELLVELSEFALSTRARAVVEGQGMKRVGDLVTADQGELSRLRNCGPKTLAEFRAVAKSVGYTLGTPVPGWNGSRHLDRLAVRYKEDLARLRAQRLRAIDSTRGVETELASALDVLLRPGDARRVHLWIGIDAHEPPTLDVVGARLGITRERVRQVVARAGTAIRASRLPVPRLRKAIAHLEGTRLRTAEAAAAELRERGLVEGVVAVRGLLRAAELFGISLEVDHATLGGMRLVGNPAGFEIAKVARHMSERLTEHWGCATVEDVAVEVSEIVGEDVSLELVAELLEANPGFQWLHENTGWFEFSDPRHARSRNRLHNRIAKVLTVAPRIELAALRTALLRDYRMEGFAPPLQVLRAICERLDGCASVDRRTVVDKHPKSPGDTLSGTEQRILALFRQRGPVLTFTEMRDRLVAAGMEEGCSGIISTTPILQHLERGVYALVGEKATRADIERARQFLAR